MRVLRGKTALVTGAAAGLGRAIALRLAHEGTNLHLLDIDEPGLEKVLRDARQLGVTARGARCDLTRPEQVTSSVEAMLAEWGGLNILVNNAGVGFYGPTTKMTAEQWDWLLAINLRAPIQLVHELLPALLASDEAHIVNMASICGIVAGGRFCAYHVSKFGMVGLSEALRAEFGRFGLGVSAICPGPVLTNLYKSSPCGHADRETPCPPRLICTTAERVATKTIRAIRRDKRLVLVSPLAYTLYYMKRVAPGFLDSLQRIGRRKKMKKRRAEFAAAASQSASQPKRTAA